MTDMQAILDEREKTHGRFADVASFFAARAMDAFRAYDAGRLNATQFATLVMDEMKNARILAGDPSVAEHWQDKAGYALLVVRELEGRGE